MKKLLLLAVFALGTIVAVQAQQLDYVIFNNSAATWDYKMIDDGTNTPVYELGIAPSTQRTGTITGFAFNLEWAASNGTCYVTNLETGPLAETTIACVPGASVTYKIVQINPTYWVLKMQLN